MAIPLIVSCNELNCLRSVSAYTASPLTSPPAQPISGNHRIGRAHRVLESELKR